MLCSLYNSILDHLVIMLLMSLTPPHKSPYTFFLPSIFSWKLKQHQNFFFCHPPKFDCYSVFQQIIRITHCIEYSRNELFHLVLETPASHYSHASGNSQNKKTQKTELTSFGSLALDLLFASKTRTT